MQNSTYLFELPFRKFHNSESWWSSLAYLSLVLLSRQEGQVLPVYKCTESETLKRQGHFLWLSLHS